MKPKNETQSLVPQPPAAEFGRAQLELLKRVICRGSSDDEFQLFLAQCRRTGTYEKGYLN
jgi:hypothetical protein